jgi:hypothetical protein
LTDIEQAPTAPVVMDDGISGDVPVTWYAAMRLTARIANTPFVPKAIRGDHGSVLACIITGEELGLGPMQSLRMVNVIDGRPSASAELMRALVNRAGHRLDVVEARQDRVTLAGMRRDTGAQAKVTWTIGDAQQAKLTGNPSWSKFPRSMLLARATSELCRMLFADVIGGLYTPEETAAIEGHAYTPSPNELTEAVDVVELVDPVSSTVLSAEDELDAAWRADAGVDPETGELLRDTPSAS